MQAERLGVEIEVFLCAVCRHRQVVVAVDTRHGHLLPGGLVIAPPLWAADEVDVESHELLFTCYFLARKVGFNIEA
jgi:hypothetical protein